MEICTFTPLKGRYAVFKIAGTLNLRDSLIGKRDEWKTKKYVIMYR